VGRDLKLDCYLAFAWHEMMMCVARFKVIGTERKGKETPTVVIRNSFGLNEIGGRICLWPIRITINAKIYIGFGYSDIGA